MKTKLICLSISGILLTALATPSRPALDDLKKIDFATECTTHSDPSNRLNYEHEDLVTNFILVPGSFGMERMIPLVYAHEHLATHLGTRRQPRTWRENQSRYQLDDWGLVGDLRETDATVYFLKPQKFFYERPGVKEAIVPDKEHVASRRTDPFEAWAIGQLKKGEKLVRWERPDFMRAVGAIRAEAACIRCHAEMKEGDLLGAFVYEFSKAKAGPPSEVQQRLTKAAAEGKTEAEMIVMVNAPQDAKRVAPWDVERELLDAGIITPELAKAQVAARKVALEKVAQMMERRKTPDAAAVKQQKVSLR